MEPIAPKHVRYIKLGPGGRWADAAFEQGELPFGYPTVPYEPCAAGDWDTVTRCLIETDGRSPGKAKDGAREIRDFYTLGADCLWVTFAHSHLWWAFAKPPIRYLGPETDGGPNRLRRTVDGWHKTNIRGEPLRMDGLSSKLTQVAAYRATICRIHAKDYLLRRINGEVEPVVAQAEQAKEGMLAAASEMIAGLHWADFEVMVDLIFARTGWQRISELGGTLKDIDLALEHPTTGERAFVQVKSKAGQSVLEDYIERFKASDVYDRMFFVCHSPIGQIEAVQNRRVHVWMNGKLADAALQAGLYDWLMEKSA